MPRPLRIEFPGACYHVVFRGNARMPVFREAADKELLVDCMAHFASLFRIRIRAYCVMVNHAHIHVRTDEANLGRYMQSFLTSYTARHNHRHDSCGHVFQGRYKAFLVEDCRAWSSKCTRYIHLNPARIPGLDDAPVETRREAIRQCRWSSLGAVLGLRPRPDWLDRDAVLRAWGETAAARRTAYARFVDAGLVEDIADPLEAAAAGGLIGGEAFIDRLRRALTDLSENVNVRRESAQQRRLASWCALERVLAAVAGEYGCEQAELLRRYNRGCEARQVLLCLAATHCRGRYSLSELGLELGPVTVSTIAAARQRVAAHAAEDSGLRQRIDAIEETL